MSCGNGTKTKDDPFVFRNHYPLPVRVMIGLFGGVLWLLPYALLIAPGWNHFSWLLIPYGILGLLGAIGGTSFLLSAILGEARETRLDMSCQQLVQSSRDWLLRRRIICTPFIDIAILDMRQPHWATDETVFSLYPVLENGDSLPAFGAFPSKDEAEKIKALMGHRPNGLDGLPQHWTGAEIKALKLSMTAHPNKGSSGSCGPDRPQVTSQRLH
ncbi:hypothetical protein [Cohaesibacter celericrescens]|uniref:Uncharacterized protein n=1 Tax=Cohaesibacter celericrescens TaxID=2067669 RepID=A0A2N5XKI9_9HYPH|nr:hypothetical protein [Cohaesibacter celericrescens]PLW74958.1 hypothetical protein C0081_21890 [Cohaesibacter celericrescens]